MPTISRQDLSPSHAHITITVTREDLRPKLDSEFKKLKQRVSVKGFRPGQAPAQYVKSLYGSSIFYDVFNNMMSENLYGYLRDERLDVLGQPMPVETDQKFTFKFDNPEPEYTLVYEIGHIPAFELAGLDKKETYERYEISNLDELAAKDFENLRNESAKHAEADGNVEEEDLVRILAKEMDGDSPKAGGLETSIMVFVKSIVNEDLKTEFLSKKKGDNVRFDVNHLEDARDEKFIRKYMLSLDDDDPREVGNIFEGEIFEIKRKQAAEIDEDFFNDVFGGQADNQEDALALIKKGTKGYYENRANALVFREMQDRLLAANNVELPVEFLKRWLAASNEGKLSSEQIDAEFEQFATGLRWTVIKDKIVNRYEITVTDAEIRREFFNTLNGYFRGQFPVEMLTGAVNRMMSDKKEVERVSDNIEYDKMFNAALADVTIKVKPVHSDEFQEIFDRARNKAAEEGDIIEDEL
jgi:trigger factor